MPRKKLVKKVNKDRLLLNAKGDLVPVSLIDQHAVKEHDIVEYITSEAGQLHNIIAEFKRDTIKILRDHLDEMAKFYGENWKGNATLFNYNRTKAIEYSISNTLVFDSKIEIAKQKIYNCIARWTEGVNENLVVLVKSAFDTDKRGLVDTKRVLGLTTLKVNDPEWKEAVEILRNSIVEGSSKKYINFKVKTDEDQQLKTIPLSFSAV